MKATSTKIKRWKFYTIIFSSFILINVSSAQFNYMIEFYGPHHVTQGHRIYFNLQCTRIDTGGTSTFESIWTNLSNIPPSSTIDYADFASYGLNHNTSEGYEEYGCYNYQAIGIQTSSATPLGDYFVTVVCKSSKTNLVKQIQYLITVDPVQPLPVLSQTFCKLHPIPDSVKFVTELKNIGQHFCRDTTDMQWDYDPTLVYYEISDYLKDSTSWLPCMRTGRYVNRDMDSAYDARTHNQGKGLGIIPSKGIRPGYYIFSEGLYEDYIRRGDTLSKYGIELFANYSNYADPPKNKTPLAWMVTDVSSRETAYNMRSFIKCHDMGITVHDTRLNQYLDIALGHLDQWFNEHTTDYTRPFMVGLTMKTLIMYYSEINPDPRIFPAVKMALDSLWKNFWVSGNFTDAYKYTDVYTSTGGPATVSDLNMLVGPAYAWLYSVTGDTSYINKADTIFAGMIKNVTQWDTKQFCQNFQWTFEYIKWRNNNPVNPNCPALRLADIRNDSLTGSFEIVPNPATENVQLKYSLTIAQNVRAEVFDATGKKITLLQNSNESAGDHQLSLELTTLPKGLYFVRLNGDVKKLIVQ